MSVPVTARPRVQIRPRRTLTKLSSSPHWRDRAATLPLCRRYLISSAVTCSRPGRSSIATQARTISTRMAAKITTTATRPDVPEAPATPRSSATAKARVRTPYRVLICARLSVTTTVSALPGSGALPGTGPLMPACYCQVR